MLHMYLGAFASVYAYKLPVIDAIHDSLAYLTPNCIGLLFIKVFFEEF